MTAIETTEPIRTAGESAGRAGPRQVLALVVLLAAAFMLAVDFSILNVALPTVASDVGFGLQDVQWVATAFALCAAGFTLLFGRLGDVLGRRRLFLVGMSILGVASLVGGLAVDPAMLLAARVAQGLATALVTPAALALLTTSFPEGPLRERALGLNGALMAAGFTTGAILGGALTDILSWRWAFFINVPVAGLVLVSAPFVLAEQRPDRRPRLDVWGALTVTLGLLGVIYGLTRAGASSFLDVRAIGGIAIGAVLLAVFWSVEQRVSEPLVPVSVLRNRRLGSSNGAGVVAFATETALVFLLTLYLQRVLGYSPLAAGMTLALLGLGTVIGGAAGPRVIARVGTRWSLVGGLLLEGAAILPLSRLGADSGWILPLLVLTFVSGVANLVAIVGFMVSATNGLPDHQQGLATGVAVMSQQVGITLGIPVMSAMVTLRTRGAGQPNVHLLLDGISFALLVDAGVCAVAALVLSVLLRRKVPYDDIAGQGATEGLWAASPE